MTIQRIFSVGCCVLAVLGMIGSLKTPLVAKGMFSRGFLPLVYSFGVFLFGVLLFFSDKSKEKFIFRTSLLQGTGGKAFAFFLLGLLLILLLYVFGPFIAIFCFSFLACFVLKRHTLRIMILFSVIFTIAYYLVFIVYLKVPFRRGILFEMLRHL